MGNFLNTKISTFFSQQICLFRIADLSFSANPIETAKRSKYLTKISDCFSHQNKLVGTPGTSILGLSTKSYILWGWVILRAGLLEKKMPAISVCSPRYDPPFQYAALNPLAFHYAAVSTTASRVLGVLTSLCWLFDGLMVDRGGR